MKRNTKPQRIDSELAERWKKISAQRLISGLDRDLSVPEMSSLTLKSPHWKEVENDLMTMPRKQTLFSRDRTTRKSKRKR